jgi:gas vesicle protein
MLACAVVLLVGSRAGLVGQAMLPDLSGLSARALPTAGKCKDKYLNEIAALKRRIEELQDDLEDMRIDCEIEKRSQDVAETRAQERDEEKQKVRELREELEGLRAELAADMAAMAESANGGK